MKLNAIVKDLSVIDRIEFKFDYYHNSTIFNINLLISIMIYFSYELIRLFYLIVKLYNPLIKVQLDVNIFILASILYFLGSLTYYIYTYFRIKKAYKTRVMGKNER